MRRPSGFPDEILLTWTPTELRLRSFRGDTSTLVLTDLGFFPKALGHFRSRPQGCDQSIVLLCLEGRGTVSLRGREQVLAPGEVFLIPRGEPHEYRADSVDPWSLQWVHLRQSGSEPAGGRRRLSPPALARARDHFSDLLALASREDYLAETLRALGWWLTLVLADPPLAPLPGVLEASPVSDAARFMAERLAEPLTLARIAAVARLSPSRFGAVFRAETGSAPMAHFQRLRVQKACSLLERTALGIAAVARAVGYEDPFHFSRVFRRATGLSPRAWRKDPRG